MARTRTPGLFERILEAAIDTFMRRGYRRVRMREIAGAAGVSAGTLYLYVNSKPALFELVVRRTFGALDTAAVSFPYSTANPEGQIEEIWSQLAATWPFQRLEAAVAVDHPDDPAREFEDLVRHLYRWQFRYWRALLLVERCARDWPELSLLFYQQHRRRALALGTQLLERRAAERYLVSFPSHGIAARFIAETIAFFAMHRHTAPDSVMDDRVVEETVVQVLTSAFLPRGLSADEPPVANGEVRDASS